MARRTSSGTVASSRSRSYTRKPATSLVAGEWSWIGPGSCGTRLKRPMERPHGCSTKSIRPVSTGNRRTVQNWMTVGQLIKHISNACGPGCKGFVSGDWGIPAGKTFADLSPEENLPPAEKLPIVESIGEANRPSHIGSTVFEAVPVEHSLRAPAVGFRLRQDGGNGTFYVSAAASITNSTQVLFHTSIYIGDGATILRPIL